MNFSEKYTSDYNQSCYFRYQHWYSEYHQGISILWSLKIKAYNVSKIKPSMSDL